ncbi:hypothetical protein C8A00DRAFT_32299 [Chaetomidium leptoderma]|uniref:Uncharacterized protein n=1 Tax=Chaetomidium leptoderma TaxID=669021 RepID=A0AAN6ZXX2_9PEZI|nr:hypothetical protein C8A00DRAFT_32299 [Chaetomidium leptoderma]
MEYYAENAWNPYHPRRNQYCWPKIRGWLANGAGPQPVPACTVCDVELLVKGIEPLVLPALMGGGNGMGIGQQPLQLQRRLAWGESEWNQKIRDHKAGRAWNETALHGEYYRAILLLCGHIICPGCFNLKTLITPGLKCPAETPCKGFITARKCGHVLLHLLPKPIEHENYTSVPLTAPELTGPKARPDSCWKCDNLGLMVQTGGDTKMLPFGSHFHVSDHPPDTPVVISYYTKQQHTTAMGIMLAAGFGLGGMWSGAMYPGLSPLTEGAARIVVFEGRYKDLCQVSGRRRRFALSVLPTGFLGKTGLE